MKKLLVALTLLLSACEPVQSTTTVSRPEITPNTTATTSVAGQPLSVSKVVDGDTFVLSDKRKVRLIGVDTPETVAPNKLVECYGKAASDLTKSLLPEGTEVVLVMDKDPDDQYGRVLAYVYRRADGLFINRALIDSGAARAKYYSPNGAHRAEFEEAQKKAQDDGVGLWGACG